MDVVIPIPWAWWRSDENVELRDGSAFWRTRDGLGKEVIELEIDSNTNSWATDTFNSITGFSPGYAVYMALSNNLGNLVPSFENWEEKQYSIAIIGTGSLWADIYGSELEYPGPDVGELGHFNPIGGYYTTDWNSVNLQGAGTNRVMNLICLSAGPSGGSLWVNGVEVASSASPAEMANDFPYNIAVGNQWPDAFSYEFIIWDQDLGAQGQMALHDYYRCRYFGENCPLVAERIDGRLRSRLLAFE